jgi:hypothetical protein
VIECLAGPAADGHEHTAWVDQRTGNGVARPAGTGHMHEIIKGQVLDSGTGHTHPLLCAPDAPTLPHA